MKTVAIIDYNMGNIDSVVRAVKECGGSPLVTNKASEIESSQFIILPGVGASPDAMSQLKKYSLDEVLREQILDKEKPFLGICLGMQVMVDMGLERGETKGLGLLPGIAKRFEADSATTRIPHIGWNEVNQIKDSPILKDIPMGTNFYFVHSYHVATDEENVIAQTPYCGEFNSIISIKRAFGVQFHPEKSQKAGFKLLKNFLALY